MKVIIAIISAIFFCNATVSAADSQPFSVYMTDFTLHINGEEKQTKSPILLINDCAYLPIRELGNLFGYNIIWNDLMHKIDVNSNNVKYNEAKLFQEDNLYGYKNSDNTIMISAQYRYAEDFNEGLALVQFKDYSYGFINMRNMIIYKNDDMPVTGFRDGVAIVCRTIDESSYYDLKTNSGIIVSDLEKKYFLIDKSGNKISNEYSQILSFCEGMAVVQIEGTNFPFDKNNKYSYIYKNGELATSLAFKHAESFKSGFANVVTIDGRKGKIDKSFVFYPNNEDDKG